MILNDSTEQTFSQIAKDYLMDHGFEGLLLLLILYFLLFPEKLKILSEYFLFIPFFLFKVFSKKYISTHVDRVANNFIRFYLEELLSFSSDINIKIKWVTDPSDPILKKDGTLIIRLDETRDQTRNILTATRISLPYIAFPKLRVNIKEYIENAIDLAVLRKLADRMGKYGPSIFQKYFIEKELGKDSQAIELYKELKEIDDKGIFIAIFIEELNRLGEILYSNADLADRSEEIIKLLNFLLKEARRKEREIISTKFKTEHLSIAIIPIAITKKAKSKGPSPYIDAIEYALRGKYESIYLIVYNRLLWVLDRLMPHIESNTRLILEKVVTVDSKDVVDEKKTVKNKIAYLRTVGVEEDNTFNQMLKSSGIKVGKIVEGIVEDVAPKIALVDVKGMLGTISCDECSWLSINRCIDYLEKGEKYKFEVKKINLNLRRIILTRRISTECPWENKKIPDVGDKIQVVVYANGNSVLLSKYDEDIEIEIPYNEISWMKDEEWKIADFLNSTREVVIYEKNEKEKRIKASIKRMSENPWNEIGKKLITGDKYEAEIMCCKKDMVLAKIQDGIVGYIPIQFLVKKGYSNKDIDKRFKRGEKIEVEISKVDSTKGRIRLDIEG